MLLAVEAFHQDPTLIETRSALLSSQSQHFTARLTGHASDVFGVAFSPDGRTLATTSTDSTTRLWDPDPARVTARNCQLIGTVTQARWEQLIPELPYQPPCP